MRRLLVVLLALPATLGCATRGGNCAQTIVDESETASLQRYAFAACLEADSLKSPATARSLALNLEAGRAPIWKYPQLAACARTYIESRRSTLTNDLTLDKCLAFTATPALASAIAAAEGEVIQCASTAKTPFQRGPPPAID